MELYLYTGRIGSYRGPDAYDITAKSGDKTFAPTWQLVLAWKQGEITWDQYHKQYRALMIDSYRQNTKAWDEMLRKGTLTLTCYCTTDEQRHCHRYLLAEFLTTLAEKAGITVVNKGERPHPDAGQQTLFSQP